MIKWRLVFSLLGCFGMAIIYGLKVNLSVAIVAMVNQTAIKGDKGDHHGSQHSGGNISDAVICTGPEDEAGVDQSVSVMCLYGMIETMKLKRFM